MFDWLRQFPDLLLIALAAVVSISLVALTGLLPPRHGTVPPSPASVSALEAYKIIVSFTAILLSFALVQAVGALRSTEINVSREAGAINMLDRLLTRYGIQTTNAIRPILFAYGQSLVMADWPAMQQGKGSPVTTGKLRAVNRAIQTLESGQPSKPLIYAEMLKQLDTINDSRQERIDSSSVGLPQVLWEATSALSGILLLLSYFIRMPARLIAIGCHAVAISMLTIVVFTVDQPFKGQTSTSPAAIERVLTAIQGRTD